MATTTNFGFETPDDTDLVKDGALAMRTLGNNIDARFGNVATYPNQIVNVVSGVSRPLPYAISTGRFSLAGTSVAAGGSVNATVTFATSTRFTQVPVIALTQTSLPGGAGALVTKATNVQTTGFTGYLFNLGTTTTTFAATQVDYCAVQMTSASATNS